MSAESATNMSGGGAVNGPHVELRRVTKRYGAVTAISDLSLAVDKGSFTALLGPSGCGKLTLLRMIAGLETITAGQCFIDNIDVTDTPPAKRRIAMVFQAYALYPHMTVRQNIAFPLSIAGASKHKQTEAMTLADKSVVLDKGVGSQVGSPLELYNAPANRFVAAFIGSPGMNFLGVDIVAMNGRTASVVAPGGRTAQIRIGMNTSAGPASAELGVRPEHLAIADPNDPHVAFAGAILIVEHLGNSTILYVDTPAGQPMVEGDGNLDAKPGQAVGLRLNESHARLFGEMGAAL